MKKIGIILSATREGRVGEQIANYVLSQAPQSTQHQYTLIDLKAVNLPLLDEPYPAAMQKYQFDHTKAWSKLIAGYDAFIVVTPEYNHGYPAALKNALDYLYVEWQDKPAAIVAYGYSASGARAAEQVRALLNYLKCQVCWKEVLINLSTSLKDQVFNTNDELNKQIQALFDDFEKLLV